MPLLVDGTTGLHTRGIGTVVDGILGALPAVAPDAVAVRSVAIARTRPGRLAYQRLLLPFHVAALRRAGHDIDQVLLLDSYLPKLRIWPRLGYGVLVHDLMPLTHPKFWPREKLAVKRSAFRSIQKARPVVFTSTAYNADAVAERLGIEARVARFGCGQISDAAADEALRTPLPGRGTQLVAIGALEPRKNLLALIDIVERASDSLELRLVGRGSPAYETQLRARIERSPAARRIRLEPSLSPDAALDLLSHAAALLFPSLAEGFGLPILEALALGTPVVASDLPEIRSWTGAAVRHVPPGDTPAWVAAISAAVDAPEEERRAGQRLAASYRWARCTQSLVDW
jgi:glycosyltransferase involved in cell wall biosynthesis